MNKHDFLNMTGIRMSDEEAARLKGLAAEYLEKIKANQVLSKIRRECLGSLPEMKINLTTNKN